MGGFRTMANEQKHTDKPRTSVQVHTRDGQYLSIFEWDNADVAFTLLLRENCPAPKHGTTAAWKWHANGDIKEGVVYDIVHDRWSLHGTSISETPIVDLWVAIRQTRQQSIMREEALMRRITREG